MKKILIFLFLITSSCSSTEGFMPGFIPDFISKYFEDEVQLYADLPDYTPDVEINLIWKKGFSAEIEDSYSFLNIYKLNEDIYIPTNNRKIHVVSADLGSLKNSIELDLDIFSGIVVDSKLIYFGSKQDTVTAIDKSDHSVLWQRIMSSEVMSISEVENNILYVRTNDSKITAIDVATGKFLWINSQIPAELSIRGSSSPIVHEEKVFVGFEDGKIVSYNYLKGDIIWQSQLPAIKTDTLIDRLNDIDGAMILENGVLYAISYQGSIAAIDSFSGQVLWYRESSSIYGIDTDDDNIYYIDDDGVLWCLDKSSGRPVWKQDQLYKRLIGTPIFYNNFVIARDFENYLHILKSNDGSISGRIKLKYQIQSYYVEYDSLYLLDKDFSLKKYQINEIVKE